MKVILRIIVFPLFAAIHLIYGLYVWIKMCYDFIVYGGESIVYRKGYKASIAGIYEELKQLNK